MYALGEMPPGRFPFRRWRWELWSGAMLLASGWRTSERQAERALRTTAARVAHARLGLHPLRPDETESSGSLLLGLPTRVHCGAVSCLLVPRADPSAA